MIKEGKIGRQEVICLLVIACMNKIFFSNSSIVARLVGTAGWYMVFFSTIFAMGWFSFTYLLLKRFPGHNIMAIYDKVLGKYIGSFFSLIILIGLIISAALNLREYIEVLKIYVFPDTQPTFLIAFFMLTVIFVSFLGLENIARYSKLVFYAFIFGLALLYLLGFKHYYQVHRLFPILGYGLGNTIYHGFLRSSALAEIIILGIFSRSLHGIKELKQAGYFSIIIIGLIISITNLVFISTFSYFFGRELSEPIYLLASLLNYGLFFQRVEAIFLFLWSMSTLLAITILFYTVLTVYKHMFNIDDTKPLIMPFSVILFVLSMIPLNFIELTQVYNFYFRQYSWIVFFLPSVIAFLVALFRNNKVVVDNA